MANLKLQKEYKIHVYETGVDSKLNVASLFNYLQDIASDHAEILGFGRDDLMKHNHFWALSRMYAEISLWPQWGESIIVTTYPNGTDKLFALRNYEVSYPDGRHIAFATSSWLILDQSTRRIQRPEAALTHFNRHSEMQESPLRYASKLEFSEGEIKNSDRFKVKISDLDVNLHTNNVKYLQWINDSYDIDFVKQKSIHSTEINYLSELFYNDEVFLQTRADADSYYNHSVMRSDGKEVCRVRLGWK
jgi:acyl-ACP thioesterase